MDHRLICSWLGISPDQWPPDHYTLLNLEPGEADRERIEQHAHERLACLRRYQLANPELATEAMNRLAQAVVCLTDPVAKTAYDAALAGEQLVIEAPPIRREAEQPAPMATSTATADPLAWLFGPWNPLNAEPALPPPAPVTAIDWTTAPPPARIPVVPVAPPGPAETIVGANGT